MGSAVNAARRRTVALGVLAVHQPDGEPGNASEYTPVLALMVAPVLLGSDCTDQVSPAVVSTPL